jgi:hypothetical protein
MGKVKRYVCHILSVHLAKRWNHMNAHSVSNARTEIEMATLCVTYLNTCDNNRSNYSP